MGVDVDATVQEPAQAGRVLEVQLVEDHPVEAGLVEQVEEGGVRPLAGVVDRVLVLGGATLDEQPGEREIATFDRVEQRRPPALAAPLDGVAVGVGAGVQQQPRAATDIRRRAG